MHKLCYSAASLYRDSLYRKPPYFVAGLCLPRYQRPVIVLNPHTQQGCGQCGRPQEKTNLALIPVAEMNFSAHLLDIQFYVIKTFISETRAISVKQ